MAARVAVGVAPEERPPLRAGQRVRICGLVGRSRYNGRVAVVEVPSTPGTELVRLRIAECGDVGPGTRIHVSAANVEEVPSIAETWAAGEVASRRSPTAAKQPLLPRWPSGSTTASGESLDNDGGGDRLACETPSKARTPATPSAEASRRRGGEDEPRRGAASAMRPRSQSGLRRYRPAEESSAEGCASSEQLQGRFVTGHDIRYGLPVVRSTRGSTEIGKVLGYDLVEQTATVHWQTSGLVTDGLRLGECGDLCVGRAEDAFRPAECTPGGSAEVRRNSQGLYARRSQTCILLDWDDTLFPTAHLRKYEAANRSQLSECHAAAFELVQLASTLGHVVIITLAQPGWVTQCCNRFFPKLGRLINDLNIRVVYARAGESDQPSHRAFSNLKAHAIASELTSFYSQYEGQSWKNLVSIGDSEFERDGTKRATAEYLCQLRLSAFSGRKHLRKVRAKTFKLAECPSLDELVCEMGLLRRWLPGIVTLDESVDLELEDVSNHSQIRSIESALQAGRPWSSPGAAGGGAAAVVQRRGSMPSRPSSPAGTTGSPWRRRPETPGSVGAPPAMLPTTPSRRAPAWHHRGSPGRAAFGATPGSATPFHEACF